MSPRAATQRPKIDPKQPQDDLEEVFFSHGCSSSILVRFGCDFGPLWAPFLEPKSVIFRIDFWMIFACRSKIAPGAAPEPPRASQERRRAAQERPREPQERPKSDPKRPKSGQERTNAAKINTKKQSNATSKSKQQSSKIQSEKAQKLNKTKMNEKQ